MTAMNIHVNIVAESNKEMRDVPILFIVEWSLELPRIEHSGALQAQSHPKKESYCVAAIKTLKLRILCRTR